jgi:hypothetical protein
LRPQEHCHFVLRRGELPAVRLILGDIPASLRSPSLR